MYQQLIHLAEKTEQRIGNHPEAKLVRDAAKYLSELEDTIESLREEISDLKTVKAPAKRASK